jgi:hypothetical protein
MPGLGLRSVNKLQSNKVPCTFKMSNFLERGEVLDLGISEDSAHLTYMGTSFSSLSRAPVFIEVFFVFFGTVFTAGSPPPSTLSPSSGPAALPPRPAAAAGVGVSSPLVAYGSVSVSGPFWLTVAPPSVAVEGLLFPAACLEVLVPVPDVAAGRPSRRDRPLIPQQASMRPQL